MTIMRKRIKKTESMQIRFTPVMKEALRAEAEEKGITIAMVIEDAIIHYFEDKPFLDGADSAQNLENRIRELENEVFKKRKK